jgi:hypothetical protein
VDIFGWIVLAIFALWLWGRATHMGIATTAAPAPLAGNSGGCQFNGATGTIAPGITEPTRTGLTIAPPAPHLVLPIDAPPPLAIQTKPVTISSTGVIQSKVPITSTTPRPQVRVSPVRYTLPGRQLPPKGTQFPN